MSVDPEWFTLAGIVAVLAFLWSLQRDISDLRERMARLEGLFEGFTRNESRPPAAHGST